VDGARLHRCRESVGAQRHEAMTMDARAQEIGARLLGAVGASKRRT